MIVQELHKIQHEHGYLPREELIALANRTKTHLHSIQEVASFFPHFRTEKPPATTVRVCRDMSCRLRASQQLTQDLANAFPAGSSGGLKIEGVSCLGRCDRAPAVCVEHGTHERYYLARDLRALVDVIKRTADGNPPPPDTDAGLPVQAPEPWKIDCYAGDDSEPYRAVKRFIECSKSPEAEDQERARIIQSLQTAGLLGMGGAGGRAYKKWADVREAKGDVKYVVCNGDESEPGTFKDRELLLRAPHLVVEGVILGGLYLRAERGYIYIRHEFEEQIEAVRAEIKRAQQMQCCGQNILNAGIDFDVEVFVSPGGYICGEQTALIEAMEDKRAEPRNRPPELQTNGLWNKPTLLNNVETLSWVPAIVLKEDGQWFADEGAGEYLGRRFFSISGDVAKPGAYEVPIGITLGKLIEDFAGGMRDGQPFKAIALSGPSGGFLPRMLPVEQLSKRFVDKKCAGKTHFDLFDMEMDIGTTRQMGVMMGGGIVVYSELADMVEAALACSQFFRNESCGKCVPCRIGSQKLVEICADIAEGKSGPEAVFAEGGRQTLVEELADTMKLTAICGLGTVASNPLSTLLTHFADEVRDYLRTRFL